MAINILDSQTIKNTKPHSEKTITINDGAGMYLEIVISGSKRWRFRYSFNNKLKKVSLGVYPDVTLSDARKKRDIARNKVANNIDPFPPKLKKSTSTKRTFRECADLYAQEILIKKSDAHYNRTVKGWKRDVFVQSTKDGKKDKEASIRIGDTFINDITVDDIKLILLSMKNRDASESARKVFSSISLVFQYIIAVQTSKDGFDKVERNPCKDIELKFVLGTHQRKHYPVITEPKALGTLLNVIDAFNGNKSIQLALKMIANVFVRPGNIRFAVWDEISLKEKRWTIPASKMKTNQDLIVPLSAQVLQILKEASEYTGEKGLIFPSPRSKTQPLSNVTMVAALRRMSYTSDDIVAHSFRAIFSTIAHEAGKFEHAVIETQLSHSVGTAVSQAYNRAIYLKERTEMMQWYSDLLEGYKYESRR